VVGRGCWDWVDRVVYVSGLWAVVCWANLALVDGDRNHRMDIPRKELRLKIGWEPFVYSIKNLDEHCSTLANFLRLQMMSPE